MAIDFVTVNVTPEAIHYVASAGDLIVRTGTPTARTPEERLTVLERLRAEFPEAKFDLGLTRR